MKDINFREIKASDAELILSWRTKERISKYMNSNVEFDIDKQKKWIESCYNKDNYYHWIIQSNTNPIGVICIKDINLKNSDTSWGFYIGDEAFLGIGGFIPPFFYNWIFSTKKIMKIKAFVFDDLINVMKLHQFHKYKFIPDEDQYIKKNGLKTIVRAMYLNIEEWEKSNYKKFIAPFPTEHWLVNPFSFKSTFVKD